MKSSWVYQLLENIVTLFQRETFSPNSIFHGEKHIENVLKQAIDLIPQDLLANMREDEVECFLAAVTIHDLSLFITEDGFKRLVFGSQKDSNIKNCLD